MDMIRAFEFLISFTYPPSFATDYYCILILLALLCATLIFYLRHKITPRYGGRTLSELAAPGSMSLENGATSTANLRFRKRDKILFYGRRMIRKMKNVSGQMYNGQGRKRRAVMRFAGRLLQLRRDNMPLEMKTVEPPVEYLEEELLYVPNERASPDALLVQKGIRIFGHFETPICGILVKHMSFLRLKANDYLFNTTDADDSVFIVQSGAINVFAAHTDGSMLSLKTAHKGESVTSLLSFIDVLSGTRTTYRTVTAKASEDSVVLRLPMRAFIEVFDQNADDMVRVVQAIMIRLQRVLFTVLRNYLGLNAELIQANMRQQRRAQQSPAQQQSPLSARHAQGNRSPDTTPSRERNLNINEPLHSPSSTDQLEYLFDNANFSSPSQAQSAHQRRLSLKRNSPTATFETASQSSPLSIVSGMSEQELRVAAVECLRKELGLCEQDAAIIEPFVEVRELESGDVLIVEGNTDDVCVWLVLTGMLTVYQNNTEPSRAKPLKNEVLIHSVSPGEVTGGLAVLTGEASTYTIRARNNSRVAFIRRAAIYQVMRERPRIVLDLSSTVVRRLSSLVRQCDYALEWMFLESGRALYRQDESSDSTYIVLSGRMRSVNTTRDQKKEIVGEYGKGDLVGLVEMITETSRTTTVLVVRDSELAKLPKGLFNALKLRHPVVVSKLISFLSHRFLGTMQSRSGGSSSTPIEANSVTHKYSTVALVPINEDVPLTPFTYELYHSLCAIGPTLRLTSDIVRKQLGANIFEPTNEYRLASWLAQQEDRNIITMYQCDTSLSAWTQRCMRQADVVLIVGLGFSSHFVDTFEREIDRLALRTQKELVLLYPENTTNRPTHTLRWLNARPWVTKHHHMICMKRIFTRKSQYRINDLYSRVLLSEPNMHSDFSRLARWLTGNSIGLVLGGGGARGAAHIGMLKAIQEADIPIDMVGGVSIGALMGALWCADREITAVTKKAKAWSHKMTKWYLQLIDLTYPITSMFSGREFNKTLKETFGELSIEDLWIPYFTLTTDITASSHRIHTNGSLWRYVRSSMSLSGYMPPLCDPKDGHLLLDGGYVNNLPADVMRNLGAAHIIAIDVGSQDDTDLTNYGDDLSGWWLLYKKWNPFTAQVKVPDLSDIQSRLAYVSCVRQLEEVKNSDYCEYIRPPIDKYKTLAFGSFDEIRDVGYVHGKSHFECMAKAGRLGRFNRWFSKLPPDRVNHASLNEYTFVDLAQIVCKLPVTYVERQPVSNSDFFSEDEDYDGYISEPSIFPRDGQLRIERPSTSLSETELDSDLEIDLTLRIRRSSINIANPRISFGDGNFERPAPLPSRVRQKLHGRVSAQALPSTSHPTNESDGELDQADANENAAVHRPPSRLSTTSKRRSVRTALFAVADAISDHLGTTASVTDITPKITITKQSPTVVTSTLTTAPSTSIVEVLTPIRPIKAKGDSSEEEEDDEESLTPRACQDMNPVRKVANVLDTPVDLADSSEEEEN